MPNDEMMQGTKVFQTLCSMLDHRNWKYEKDEEKLTVKCTARGDDLPMPLHIRVDCGRYVLRFFSPIFTVDEKKRQEMALAVAMVNFVLVNGCFALDLRDGELTFRLAAPYHDSILSESLLDDLLIIVCMTVDEYNDKLFMLGQNMMTLEAFKDFVYKK